jgi:hypothetical protein
MGRDPGKGLLGLEECAGRIKELRRQREDLRSRRVDLQKKSRAKKKLGYKKEFLREILKEVRVRGSEVRLTYRLPMQ